MWLAKFLHSRDIFGHRIDVYYKGRESFNTSLGGLLTIMTQSLTAVLIYKALFEVIFMEEPEIVSYSKPLTKDEKGDLSPLHFGEYDYVLAFEQKIWDFENATWIEERIPREVGKILASQQDEDEPWR